jgi:hypothetical protein
MALPATMRITLKDGTSEDVRMPAETWIQSGEHVFTVDTHQPIASVVIDPDHHLPESDRSNSAAAP